MGKAPKDSLKRHTADLVRAVGTLPEGAHGRIILHVQAGRVRMIETHETELVPEPLDKGARRA